MLNRTGGQKNHAEIEAKIVMVAETKGFLLESDSATGCTESAGSGEGSARDIAKVQVRLSFEGFGSSLRLGFNNWCTHEQLGATGLGNSALNLAD
ncbi:hypothetical protein OROMI_011581 [Orobanche minor]